MHKKMDEFSIAALIHKSNIRIGQWKVIIRSLKLFLGVDNFCVLILFGISWVMIMENFTITRQIMRQKRVL